MDLKRFIVVGLFAFSTLSIGACNLVFPVQHKFKGRERSLSALKSHDVRRHERVLSAVDLELGGNGHPSETGLYFTKLGLGSPPKDFYVQVDTGSDILWVNCVGCTNCPKKSDIGIELTLYDPKSSGSSDLITCNQEFCTSTYDGPIPGCQPELLCQYKVTYGDGSATAGYFVKDYVQLDRVSGNFQTSSTNGSVIFGCGARQSGELGTSSEALDGIIGFGQSNSSMISQLAASGKVRKMFAHCLDSINGGGIFAIGNVVQPQMGSTPLVQHQSHYNVIMKAVEVGGDVLDLPSDVFDTDNQKGTIIDSGTTLAYLPEVIYQALMTKVFAPQPGLKVHTVDEQFICFNYDGNVDDGFPVVKFHFQGSIFMTIYPHEYLFQIRDNVWCVGWQNSGAQSKDGQDMSLLGGRNMSCCSLLDLERPKTFFPAQCFSDPTADLVLQNKLVFYNLENQTIGWTEYNCSSSIKVEDESSGAVYTVGAENLTSASSMVVNGKILILLSTLIPLLHMFRR